MAVNSVICFCMVSNHGGGCGSQKAVGLVGLLPALLWYDMLNDVTEALASSLYTYSLHIVLGVSVGGSTLSSGGADGVNGGNSVL